MYLKNLTIRGFKSFPRKTTLVFEPGLTAIIGPNGSGKSNIVDAILWVFGEQNPRFLRGLAMVDVVFAGTETVPPASFAEVTLVFDNSDGALPVEQSEVAIKRRVTREGETAYFINERACRLSDVRDLVARAGLGDELPGIIPQNRLLDLIESNRSDVRAIIEEASGLSYYRRRRETALKRIVRVDDRLAALRTVKAELDRELRPLKKQVDRMRRAGDLKAALQEAWLTLALLDLNELKARHEELVREAALLEGMLEEVARKEHHLEQERLRLETLSATDADVARDEERVRKLRELEERVRTFAALVEEKGRAVVEAFSRARQDIFSLERRIGELEAERTELARQEEQVRERLAGMSEERETLTREMDELRESRGAVIERLRKAEDEHRRALEREQSARKTRDERAFAARRLEEEFTRIGARLDEVAREKERAQREVSSLEPRLPALAKRREEIEALRTRRLEELKDAENERALQRARIHELDGRIAFLEKRLAELDRERARFVEDGTVPLGVTLAKLEGMTDDIARPLAAILGEAARAIPLKMPDEADSIGETVEKAFYIEEDSNRDEKASFDTWEAVKDEIPAAVARLFERYRRVASVRDAIERWMKGERSGYVTADGSRLTPEGFILPPPATQDVLELERERHTLAEELEGARKERERLAASLVRLDEEIGRLGDECGRLERESVALEQEMQAVERQIEDGKARVARFESERLRLKNERSSIETQAREAREQASRAEGDEAQAREERRVAGSAVEEARAELASLDDTMRSMENRLSTLEAIETEVSNQLASLVKRTAKLEQEIAEAQERRASLTPVLDAREQQRARIQRVFAACSGLEETISRRIREITLSRSGEFERFEAYRREVARIMKESVELSNQKEKLLTRKQVIATQMVEVETRVRLKTEEMFESTGYTIERAVSEVNVAGKDREHVRREYERLKREVEAVGEYNPLAERDYERLKARSDYYARHIADLESAAQNLRVIIEEVDRRMVATFTDAFERVRSEFKQMFVRMFGGGTADMVLENADDPLESTIRITAQPPGKKLRRISLLSGGEKSLVSLAVVFALTRVFKVPFLVLDEVEPALDDLNLSRLIDLLREIARETQVIIITHQARTIEVASVVYGVTMGKDGVSSVYGQRFSEQTGALAGASGPAGA